MKSIENIPNIPSLKIGLVMTICNYNDMSENAKRELYAYLDNYYPSDYFEKCGIEIPPYNPDYDYDGHRHHIQENGHWKFVIFYPLKNQPLKNEG